MHLIQLYIKAFEDNNGFFLENIYLIILFLAGMSLIFIGIGVDLYSGRSLYFKKLTEKRTSNKFINAVDCVTSIYPIRIIKKQIHKNLAIVQLGEERLKLFANIIILGLFFMSALNIFLLRNIGQLWYVKVLLFTISIFLPYYVLTLAFDLYKQNVNRHIPVMIDEFRGAFVKHRKITPAMKECCRHIDNRLSRIIMGAVESASIETSLSNLKDRFNNIWFNIFVTLIVNYKSNGGELIDQLYKLNKTMTRYNNIEKKKSKRLIWYEIFSVAAAVFSIPAVFWLNTSIMGHDTMVIIDAESNIIISRIVAFSILSLIVARVLRRM